MKAFDDNSLSIGNTPVVKLNRLAEGSQATVYAKIEGRNPAYSVKCRIGASMIWDAEKRGILKPGMTIVEPTSGNTGIALAYVCAARGYKLKLTMPETMSIERRKVLAMFGAELVLTPGPEGMNGAISTAEQLVADNPDTTFMPQQFKNPANPRIHEETTGPELYDALDGKIDVLVAGVGTGGTISGISHYLKKTRNLDLATIAVEPENSPVITQTRAGEPLKPGPHKIQGIGAGFIPDTLDLEMLDGVETISDEEAIATARKLATTEGILCGISSGAATAVALRLGAQEAYAGKNIVVILPDAGERYISTFLFDGIGG
ncbi:MAG: cysteine synthase A [Planctomycetota bacterium]|jgi:cysteine synthase A